MVYCLQWEARGGDSVTDGKPPDDNTHAIMPDKHTERSGWKEDLLFHNDHTEGHDHVITSTSTEEEAQSPVSRAMQESRRCLRVGEFYNKTKDKQKPQKS